MKNENFSEEFYASVKALTEDLERLTKSVTEVTKDKDIEKSSLPIRIHTMMLLDMVSTCKESILTLAETTEVSEKDFILITTKFGEVPLEEVEKELMLRIIKNMVF